VTNLDALFNELGMQDWMAEMDGVVTPLEAQEGQVQWRNTTLLTRRLYALSVADDAPASEIMAGLNGFSLRDVMWCSFTGFETDAPNQVYVEHLPALKVLSQHAHAAFPLFVIDSAGAMRHATPMRLGNMFEDLRRWLASEQAPNITVILIDRYTDEVQSDAKRLMNQYCQLLK
jgi:hypothetical protein